MDVKYSYLSTDSMSQYEYICFEQKNTGWISHPINFVPIHAQRVCVHRGQKMYVFTNTGIDNSTQQIIWGTINFLVCTHISDIRTMSAKVMPNKFQIICWWLWSKIHLGK